MPNYMQMYTLFGQVYDGWDTLDKIFNTKIVDEDAPADKENRNIQPVHEIKFTKVWLSTYGEHKENGFTIPEKTEQIKVTETVSDSSKAEE